MKQSTQELVAGARQTVAWKDIRACVLEGQQKQAKLINKRRVMMPFKRLQEARLARPWPRELASAAYRKG